MSDEYIEKEDAQKWLQSIRSDCGRHQDMWHYAEALDQIIELLSADVAPVRHGRWVQRKIRESQFVQNGYTRLYCSVCGEYSEVESNYCGNCGAKMDGEGR